ncbi:MAG TPA: HAD hydrolase-like protein [Allosphingosinicella sp.]|nr:HAD hydrolase-like protein [Allosphingosinicella sp.]
MRERIAGAKGFIFDMDGTIALGDKASGGHVALPGAVDLLKRIKRKGVPLRVLTNGTAKPPAAYAASLRAAGFDLADEEMMTPSTSVAAWLVAKGIGRVRVLGDAGTAAPLADAGIDIVFGAAPAEGVEAVYTGWHRDFTFHDLEAAVRDVWAGARAVTASHVPFFATQDGKGLGTSFPMNVVIRAWTGTMPKVLGKPARECFFTALGLMGLPRRAASEVVVVGDDPKLEARMANAVGAISVCVATGLTGLDEMPALSAAERPALGLASVADLLD